MGTENMSLGTRMKRYERVSFGLLTRRMPVIIRVDGKAFHTFTRGLVKPHDQAMINSMTNAAIALVNGIQGAQLAYVQSDEISVLLTDYVNFSTEAWFDYEVQKMVSVSASIATASFNHIWKKTMSDRADDECLKINAKEWREKEERTALFDSRCFNVPREEVVNAFIWRQQDAIRNSIQGLAQSLFSHKELHGLSCNQLQEKMWQEKQVNWNDLDDYKKRGWCVLKNLDAESERTTTGPDWETPEFSQARDYIDQFVYPADEEGK